MGRAGWSYSDLSDDEDLLADDASGGKQRVPVARGQGDKGIFLPVLKEALGS